MAARYIVVELAYVDHSCIGPNATAAPLNNALVDGRGKHPMVKRGFLLLPSRWGS
jgi:hypothetical protein